MKIYIRAMSRVVIFVVSVHCKIEEKPIIVNLEISVYLQRNKRHKPKLEMLKKMSKNYGEMDQVMHSIISVSLCSERFE